MIQGEALQFGFKGKGDNLLELSGKVGQPDGNLLREVTHQNRKLKGEKQASRHMAVSYGEKTTGKGREPASDSYEQTSGRDTFGPFFQRYSVTDKKG